MLSFSEALFILLAYFSASLTHAMAGFGAALISMPLLSWGFGVQVAAPMGALAGLLINTLMLLIYRKHFDLRAVSWLALSSAFGVPVGLMALRQLDENLILRLMGLVLIGYSLYAIFTPRLPVLRGHSWALVFGFLAGCLAGAYNTPGPMVVLYATLQDWNPSEFKSNLQGFFLLNGVMVTIGHAFEGNYTPLVWRGFLLAIPASLLAMFLGWKLSARINPQFFRRLVIVLVLIIGLRMVWGA